MSLEQSGFSIDHEEDIRGEERSRIAKVIHDGVAQNLALLGLKMEVISRLAEQDPARVKTELAGAMEILKASVTDLRDVVFTLRSPDVESLGILKATKRLATSFSRQTRIAVRLDLPEECSAPPLAQASAFRAVLRRFEAVRKAEMATAISLSMREDGDSLVVIVRDDGYWRPPGSSATDEALAEKLSSEIQRQMFGCGAAVDVRILPPENVVEIIAPEPAASA